MAGVSGEGGRDGATRAASEWWGIPALVYLIKQVELAAKSHLDEIVSPHGVTAHQYTALTVLARNPGMTGARRAR